MRTSIELQGELKMYGGQRAARMRLMLLAGDSEQYVADGRARELDKKVDQRSKTLLSHFNLAARRASHRKALLFERDYTAFLLSLASSIRTGMDTLHAFKQCAELFPAQSVISREIQSTVQLVESGATEEDAFFRFAESIDHPDIELFRSALILSRQQGSSLGSCLHRLARVTRQRQSFRRKMRGAVAMQRLSAFGIAGCAIIVGIIQATSNPQGLRDTWDHSMGRCAMIGGLLLVVTGIVWMLQLSKRKV